MIGDITKINKYTVSKNMNSKFFFLYGKPGTWKTTVASNFPDALLVASEIGYQFIDGVRPLNISSWSDIKNLLRQLGTEACKNMYKTIIFDTVTGIYQMCYNYICTDNGVKDPGEVPFGKCWRQIKNEFSDTMNKIAQYGYGIVFIAHAKENEKEIIDAITKQKYTQLNVDTDLDASALNIIDTMVDFALYAHKEFNERGEVKVYAYSQLPNVYTKKRLKCFPDKIEFTYDSIVENVIKAIEQEAKEKNTTINENENINVRQQEERPFSDIQNNVIRLVQSFDTQSAFYNQIVDKVIGTLGEVKISETTPLDIDKLMIIEDFLLSLKENNNIR